MSEQTKIENVVESTTDGTKSVENNDSTENGIKSETPEPLTDGTKSVENKANDNDLSKPDDNTDSKPVENKATDKVISNQYITETETKLVESHISKKDSIQKATPFKFSDQPENIKKIKIDYQKFKKEIANCFRKTKQEQKGNGHGFKKEFNTLIEKNYHVKMTPDDFETEWTPYLTSLNLKSDSKGRLIKGNKKIVSTWFEEKVPNLKKQRSIDIPINHFFKTWSDKETQLIEIIDRLN